MRKGDYESGTRFEDVREARARRLAAVLTARTADAADAADAAARSDAAALGGGLDVPRADARTVLRAVGRLIEPGRCDAVAITRAAGEARRRLGPERYGGLKRIARHLVVDEHPSVGEWSAADREQVADGVSVIIDRHGEEGVRRLLELLVRDARPA
jgi:hypothetical protein